MGPYKRDIKGHREGIPEYRGIYRSIGGYVGICTAWFRVHVPDDEILGIWLIIVIIQFWGRLMIMMYLDTYVG